MSRLLLLRNPFRVGPRNSQNFTTNRAEQFASHFTNGEGKKKFAITIRYNYYRELIMHQKKFSFFEIQNVYAHRIISKKFLLFVYLLLF